MAARGSHLFRWGQQVEEGGVSRLVWCTIEPRMNQDSAHCRLLISSYARSTEHSTSKSEVLEVQPPA